MKWSRIWRRRRRGDPAEPTNCPLRTPPSGSYRTHLQGQICVSDAKTAPQRSPKTAIYLAPGPVLAVIAGPNRPLDATTR